MFYISRILISNGSLIFKEVNVHVPHCGAVSEERSGVILDKRKPCAVVTGKCDNDRCIQNPGVLVSGHYGSDHWSIVALMFSFVSNSTLWC